MAQSTRDHGRAILANTLPTRAYSFGRGRLRTSSIGRSRGSLHRQPPGLSLAFVLAVVLLAPSMAAGQASGARAEFYVPFVATPEAVVVEMLEMAHVAAEDIVYDLGSGDGRIVVAAAKRFGARAVGIEIDPGLVREAAENARQAGVADRVRIAEGDFFAADISEATVVTLYLLPEVNRRLLPKLLAELRPGTRIVSYRYNLGEWAPARTVQASRGTVYYWVVP